MEKTAVILMAYGSPERPEDVEPYYTHIRSGRKPTQTELQDLTRRYEAIGGLSPLQRITKSTASRFEERLRKNGSEIRVYAGMKHSNPFIAEVIKDIVSDGVTQLLALALAPHYSKMSIGGYQDAVKLANSELGNRLYVRFIDQWYQDDLFVSKWVQRIAQARTLRFKDDERVFYLFSAHSLPKRILSWKDPYEDQLLESAKKIAHALRLKEDEYGFSFQSASQTSEPWLGPDILDKIRELAKQEKKNILVVPIGFVSDHLEILFDIDREAKDLAETLGVNLERTESFNDSSDFIDILESVVDRSGFLAGTSSNSTTLR